MMAFENFNCLGQDWWEEPGRRDYSCRMLIENRILETPSDVRKDVSHYKEVKLKFTFSSRKSSFPIKRYRKEPKTTACYKKKRKNE
ncbi:hypothetical protein HOLleu_12505 [Holothuria leucospilota]|uniref:Uncharacterized protein n=1 Tax=Holothuria leucospilota TaxID=206669 RepID=A0A9Q1CBD9_HOLLE|nr:hypothetical protein HOLleu_12505 [Holothuria leucospilota]